MTFLLASRFFFFFLKSNVCLAYFARCLSYCLRGFSYCATDSTKINRALLKGCRNQPSLEKAILCFPEEERDAPTILQYTTTYQGFIRQKEKPVDATEKAEEVLEDSFGESPDILLSSIQRPLRGQVRVPREESRKRKKKER